MFWSKKYECKVCGKKYKGTKYAIEKSDGETLVVCKDCCNNHINKDIAQYEKENKGFREEEVNEIFTQGTIKREFD